MKSQNIVMLVLIVCALFVFAVYIQKVGIYQPSYGQAIHTYTPPSTPDLADVPKQFLVDDDTNYILSFEHAIVAPQSYNLNSLYNKLQTDMCSIVTDAGYDCTDANDNVISSPTGSFFSNFITGGAIADTYADVTPIVSCSRHYEGITDHSVMHGSTCPSGWDNQGVLGFIYTAEKQDTIPLYLCHREMRTDLVESASGQQTYHDHYLSADVACEGAGINDGRIGYVYTTPQTDTIPIYRCWQSADDVKHGRWNHFVSSDVNCPLAGQNWQLEATWHIINFCIDPDGGKDTSVATTVEGISSSKTDSCYNDNTVNEVYCTYLSGSGFAEQQISCPSGTFCVAGACQAVTNFSVKKTIESYNLGNQQVVYKIEVKNTGSPTSSIIRDMLPQGMIVDSSSMPFTLDVGSSALRWDVVSFGSQNSEEYEYDSNAGVYSSAGIFVITLVVNISSSVASGSNLVNYVTVTAGGKVFDGTVTLTVGAQPAPVPATPTGGVMDDYADVAQLVQCRREYKGVEDYMVSLNTCPYGFDPVPVSMLGLIYTKEKPNTVPCYSCYRAHRTDSVYGISGEWTYHDHFISTNEACEGSGTNEGTIGYVYSTAQANTVSIHRCWQSADDIQHGRWNNFVSNDATCPLEGQQWSKTGTWHIMNPCDDSDDGGKDPFVAGATRGAASSVVDSCADSDTVKEYYCSLGSLTGYASENMDCSGGSACFNGVCAGGSPFTGIGTVIKIEADNVFGNINLVAEPVCPTGSSSIGKLYEFHGQDNQYGRKFNVCMNPAYQSGIIKTCTIESDSSEGAWAYACEPEQCPAGTVALDGLIKTGMYAKPGMNTYRYINNYARVCLPGVVGGKILTHHTINNNLLPSFTNMDTPQLAGDTYNYVNDMVESAPQMVCPTDMVEVTNMISNPVLDVLFLNNNGRQSIYEFTYNKICVALVNSCQNTIQDGAETDVDCGGSACGACAVGDTCAVDSDCDNSNCVNNICTVVPTGPYCGDGNIDYGEQCESNQHCANGQTCIACSCVGIPLGPPWPIGHSCTNDASCISQYCNPSSNLCDISPPWTDGHPCAIGSECTSTYCNPSSNLCDVAPSPPWPNGHVCTSSSECTSSYCNPTTNVCAVPPTTGISYQISIPVAIPPSGLTDAQLSSFNTVLIGTCTDNTKLAAVLGTAECNALTTGKALILMQHTPYRLIVAGDSSTGVNVALNVLSNAENYDLHGPRVDIVYSGTNVVVIFPHCSDDVRNYGETGIDCGGPCLACAPTCSDGIQNQGETGVDCGGPCAACPPVATPGTSGSSGGGGGGRSSSFYQQQQVVDQEATECMDDWICDVWSECTAQGLKFRKCFLNDYPDCNLIMPKPAEQAACTPSYVPPVEPVANCYDGIQNQGEEDIDCGGPCAQCIKPVNWLLPAIIILLATAVGLGFLVFYIKFLKKPNVLSPLRKYVSEARSKGFQDAKIRTVLKTQGWSPKDIDKSMK